MIGQTVLSTQVQENIDRQPETRGRITPLRKRLVAATTAGTSELLFEVTDGQAKLIKRLAISNITAGAVDINIDAVPDGGTVGSDTAEIRGVSVPANTAVDMTDLVGGLYAPGVQMRVWASVADAIMISGYAEDVF